MIQLFHLGKGITASSLRHCQRSNYFAYFSGVYKKIQCFKMNRKIIFRFDFRFYIGGICLHDTLKYSEFIFTTLKMRLYGSRN